MNVLTLLRSRFAAALAGFTEPTVELLDMVRPSQDSRFGDYQANFAMSLAKRLSLPPREVAQQVIDRLDVADVCHPSEIAGPGFINLRLQDDWLAARLHEAIADDDRLGVERVPRPRTYVVDYSSPNVAKPMHVGHIRSTVIGDSLYRLLNFLGHHTISDNHIGDWGTQFGMLLYGYRHLLDRTGYQENPVAELGRLYRLVNRLVDYHETRRTKLPELEQQLAREREALADLKSAEASDKKAAKALRRAESRVQELAADLAALRARVAEVEADRVLAPLAAQHADVGRAVLEETAKLHAGDPENRRLWAEFLPPCLEEIQKTYRRLGVTFDYELGESFYEDRLPAVVKDLERKGLARESDGAICVFLNGFDTPMIVQKQDGAFLYATTDLATIQYRMAEFRADAILYVVDHRQSLHFQQLFATARLWGCGDVELEHVSFGTVLGEDGRPFKTRSGDTVGLTELLDEAVRRAHQIVSANDDAKPSGAELSAQERRRVAEAVGIGALKYADLAQNRVSDYVFSYDKMLAMNGNTATYMQYAHARVQSIFARGNVSPASLRGDGSELSLAHRAERALGLELLRFSEALDLAAAEYRPNHLTAYLFQLADVYSKFYEQCPVLKADTDSERRERLLLCDLTARTLRLGLSLLNIEVVEKM